MRVIIVQKAFRSAGLKFENFPSGGVSEIDCRLGNGGLARNQLVDAGDLQYVFNVFVGAGQAQFSAGLLHLSGGHHDDANAGAVEVGDSGQIKDDLLFLFTHEAAGGRFKLLAFPPDDSSCDLQDDNVRRQVPGLNLQCPS